MEELVPLTSIEKNGNISKRKSEPLNSPDLKILIKKYSDPTLKMKNNLDQFLNDLKDNMNKLKYRKCLQEIRDKESLFDEFEENWKIKDLKISCMLKIIERKFTKYSGNSKIKGLDEWLTRVDDEINKWFEILSNFDKNIEEDQLVLQFEICIKVVLEQCYNYALLSRNEKSISECVAYIGLGERLIKDSYKFTNDADCLNLMQKILLFISSLLISDNDFETAKLYQENALKLSYRELNFRVNTEEGISFENLSRAEQFYLKKVFINIVIAFYQKGVCEENIGNIIKATESYKQCKWFSFNFIKKDLPELTQFLYDVEKRAFNYHNLIKNIQNNQDNYKETTVIKNLKNSKPKLFYNEFDMLKKFEKTVEKIEGLKIDDDEENDFNKKSKGIRNLLSTTNMINNLMSDKFRGIVNSLNKIEITKLNKVTKDVIRKKLNEIKSEKVYLEKKNYRRNFNSTYELTELSKNIQNTSPYIITDSSCVTPKINATDHKKKSFLFHPHNSKQKLNQSTNESNPVKIFTTQISEKSEPYFKKLNDDLYDYTKKKIVSPKKRDSNTQAERPIHSHSPLKTTPNFKSSHLTSSKRKKGEIERFKSDIIFSKSFKKKIKFLEHCSKREFKFQKKILTLKKSEKLYVEEFNKRKVKEDCELFFNKTLKSNSKVLKNDMNSKRKQILNGENDKQIRMKGKLEIRAIKSLNHKAFEEYSKFNTKNSKLSRYTLRKEFRSQTISKFPNNIKIEQTNNQHINKIEREIEKLNKLEESYYRNIHSYSNIPNQKMIKKYPVNLTHSVESFVIKK